MEEKPSSGLRIYPNPFVDELIVESTPATGREIFIYNSLGLLIKREFLPAKARFDLKEEASGLYVIQVRDASGKVEDVVKVVKR